MTTKRYKSTITTIAFLGVLCTTQAQATLDMEEAWLDTRITAARALNQINAGDNVNYARQYLSIAERNFDRDEYGKTMRNARKALDHGVEAIQRVISRPLILLR